MGCKGRAAHPSDIHPSWHPEAAGTQRVNVLQTFGDDHFKVDNLIQFNSFMTYGKLKLTGIMTYHLCSTFMILSVYIHWSIGVGYLIGDSITNTLYSIFK